MQNEVERGFSFERVTDLDWDNALVAEDGREYREERFAALAFLNGAAFMPCVTHGGMKTSG